MTGRQAAAGLGGGTGSAVLLVWLLGHYGISITAEEGTAATGLVLGVGGMAAKYGRSFCSAVWRYGIFGIFRRLLHGASDKPDVPAVPHS